MMSSSEQDLRTSLKFPSEELRTSHCFLGTTHKYRHSPLSKDPNPPPRAPVYSKHPPTHTHRAHHTCTRPPYARRPATHIPHPPRTYTHIPFFPHTPDDYTHTPVHRHRFLLLGQPRPTHHRSAPKFSPAALWFFLSEGLPQDWALRSLGLTSNSSSSAQYRASRHI